MKIRTSKTSYLLQKLRNNILTISATAACIFYATALVILYIKAAPYSGCNYGALAYGTGQYQSCAVTPNIQFAATSGSGNESTTNVQIQVQLSNSFNSNSSIQYSVTGGTATGGGIDYTLANGTLTINSGDTTGNISIGVTNDTIQEINETVVVTLSNPNNAILGANTTFTYTIIDDEVASVHIEESGGNTAVNEDGTDDSYTLVLTSEPSADVSVAINPDSHTTTDPNSVTFTPSNWSTPQTVTVSAVDNQIVDGNRNSTISHVVSSSDTFYDGLIVNNVTVAVADDDNPGVRIVELGGSTDVTEGGNSDTFTVSLESQPVSDVSISITPNSQVSADESSVTFTSSDWNIPQTITINAINDSSSEGAHTGSISFSVSSTDPNYNNISVSALSVNITDNDTPGVSLVENSGTYVTEGGNTDTYSLVLDSQPANDVIITISPNSQINTDETSITFTSSDWNTPQVITVNAIDDATGEGNHTGTINHTASSSDPNYNGITITSVTVNIVDNDSAGVSVVESNSSTAITEDGASDTYTIVLTSAPNSDVTININHDSQVEVDNESLTFTTSNWNTPQTITVTAVDDSVAQGIHQSTITHEASSSDVDYNSISIADVVVTISDNDTAGVEIVESSGTTDVTEGGASDTYAINLSSQPNADVVLSIEPDSDITIEPEQITFTTSNWSTPQNITVNAVDNAVAEGNHTGVVAHFASSDDMSYDGVTVSTVTVNITDNDVVGVLIVQSNGDTNVSEEGETDTINILLETQPTSDVTVSFNADSQLSINPTSIEFSTSDWNIPQTVAVSAIDNNLVEGERASDISYSVTSSDTNYENLSLSPTSVTIADNDTAALEITETNGSTSVTEGGQTDTFTLELTAQPNADVIVNISQTDKLTTNPTSITFNSTNWNVPQTITVVAVTDNIEEGSHTATLNITATSDDDNFDGLSLLNFTVIINDNDVTPSPSPTPTPSENTPTVIPSGEPTPWPAATATPTPIPSVTANSPTPTTSGNTDTTTEQPNVESPISEGNEVPQVSDEQLDDPKVTMLLAYKVRVVDANGKPLENIEVTLNPDGKKAITDRDGYALFVNVKPGEYTISFVVDGKEVQRKVTLTNQDNGIVEVVTLESGEDQDTNEESSESKKSYVLPVVGLVVSGGIVLYVIFRKRISKSEE